MHPLRLSLFALLLLAVLGLSQEAEGGVQVTSDDDDFRIESGTDFNITIRLFGEYRLDSNDDNLSVQSVEVNIHFLSTDLKASCYSCAIPIYQYSNNTANGSDYNELHVIFYSTSSIFEGYEGEFQVETIMKNQSNAIVWQSNLNFQLVDIDRETNNNLGDSKQGIRVNEIIIFAVGIVGLIIAAVVRTRFPTNVDDPYTLPKSDDNNYPTSYENDRRSDEVVKQIKMLEESEMDKGTNGDDKFTKLQDLKTMYKEGLIDEKEFNKLKKEILD